MTHIKVLLADDHPVTRTGIRKLLEQATGIAVVGEANDGAETLQLVEALAPDVLLLDMEMPSVNGIEVTQQLRSAESPVRILALSAYDDRQYIMELLSGGAAGYLMKEEAPEFIIEAVRGVARGERGWVSRQVAARLTTWAQQESDKSELTDREKQVLEQVVEGKTNQEIGLKLGISDKTVEKHLESVFGKLGVSSRVEAAVRAVREDLV